MIRVRAPATTANLGPGFDCAAIALDRWNELELSEGDGGAGREHLGVQAFEKVTSARGKRLVFGDRIPRERGLGSSAAVIALGLVAATLWEGQELDPERLLALGLPLEGHADNLAAALAGGCCLTWDGRIARVAEAPPAVPIVIVPQATVSTAASRAALPGSVPHSDAAYTVARAALLGASLASGSEELFAAALSDRLHEPYRMAAAPRLRDVREDPPQGALGATISGSGPTVVVWARADEAGACEDQVRERFPDETVLRLATTPRGAGPA
jgi:homoserine kinase